MSLAHRLGKNGQRCLSIVHRRSIRIHQRSPDGDLATLRRIRQGDLEQTLAYWAATGEVGWGASLRDAVALVGDFVIDRAAARDLIKIIGDPDFNGDGIAGEARRAVTAK